MLYERLLEADCPAEQAAQFAAWLDENPGYEDTVEDAACTYTVMENGIGRVRFFKTDCDRFSQYDANADETVVYQLWLVDGEVRQGMSGVLTPTEPELRLDEDCMLADLRVGQPIWNIDLNEFDGFYAVDSAQMTGFAGDCGWCDEQYSNGQVTLCFLTGGMESLVHVHVQSGDTAYLGVRLGDSVDDLIEALEQQSAIPGRRWIIYREDCHAISYGCGIRYAEHDGRITELLLFSFV